MNVPDGLVEPAGELVKVDQLLVRRIGPHALLHPARIHSDVQIPQVLQPKLDKEIRGAHHDARVDAVAGEGVPGVEPLRLVLAARNLTNLEASLSYHRWSC